MTPAIGLLVIGGILLVSGWKGSSIVDTFAGKFSAPGSNGSNGSNVPAGTTNPNGQPITKAGYTFPFDPGFSWGRIDQGVDFTGKGNVRALGDAVIREVHPQNSGTGWPGAGGKGTGAKIVYELIHPIQGKYKYIYVNENIDPVGIHVGMQVRAGQVIAHARGFYPFLETGIASDASGTPLTPYNASDYEQATPGGGVFARILHSLQANKYIGGPH